jgi:hypothetical protein
MWREIGHPESGTANPECTIFSPEFQISCFLQTPGRQIFEINRRAVAQALQSR